MSKETKYIITSHKGVFTTTTRESRPLTLKEAIEYYQYTLSTGKSYERGGKKINLNPKTIKSLITNLTNAINNSSSCGYGGYYEYRIAN